MIAIAETGLVIILSMTLLMHLCILLKWIPYQSVWGGRLQSDQDMYRFETVSVLVTLICIWIAFERLRITDLLPEVYQAIALWAMALLFAFNTLGNLLSKNKLEKVFFTPVTFLLSLCCIILALH